MDFLDYGRFVVGFEQRLVTQRRGDDADLDFPEMYGPREQCINRFVYACGTVGPVR
jgi:hypothetical protein